MYLKIKNKKVNILEYTKFTDRFKTFKFYLKQIDFGIKVPNKIYASTFFFCQRVDICFTDNDDNILYLYLNVKSEKRFLKPKAKNVYYLPVGVLNHLSVGDKLCIKK